MDSAAPLRVTLLGAFEVSRGETAVVVSGARLQGLLARLALAGGRPVEPGVLLDAIWPEEPPASPVPALQTLVSRLRRTLGSAADVTQVPGGYRLGVEAADVDAVRFEQLARAGRDRLRVGDPETAVCLLDEAVALWGDQPGTEPAVVAAVAPAAATRLAGAAVEAVADLAEAELALGRAPEAAGRLLAVLAGQPVHERAAALLMDALTAQGRQAEALAVYERTRGALADSLGADPGGALRERHLRLLRPGRRDPAADGPPVRAGSLPAPLTSFVGRGDDLTRIATLLASGRLVTVLGPGGAGKTRLAVEAARGHRHEYRDGAWLIDLTPVTEPARVGAAVLTGIGLRGGALAEARTRVEGDELDVVVDALGGRQTLLLVDNCEHLIDTVAHLVAGLLAHCPGLSVLATSREPLAIDGEALVPLGPLALPGPDDGVEAAHRTASVRLFAERAAAVRPGFTVDESTLGEVRHVVRSLDGMPLALELAAARLRTLTLAALSAGLSDRFGLLTTGARTAVPRHRSLREVIAWSWDPLGPDARTVAERISVLPGGVTPASAAAVCAGTAVAPDAVPDLLADLVERSLLQLDPDTGRYRMLETIREYGLERLAEGGTLTVGRDLAARHVAALVARNDPRLRGREQLDALRLLDAEYDNVLATLRHLCDTGDAAGAIGLLVDLTWYGQMAGRDDDAADWFGEVVALPPQGPSTGHDLAEAVLLLTESATRSEPDADLAEPRRERLRELTDRLLLRPQSLGVGGTLIAIRLATVTGAEAAPEFIQQLADGPDRWLSGLARMFRAQLAESEGHVDRMGGDVDGALASFTRAGDRWGLITALPLRARLRQDDGDLAGARADLEEAKRLAREFGSLSLSDEIVIDLRLVDLHVRLGDPARAAELIAAARERVRRSTAPDTEVLLDAADAGLQVLLGDLDRARELVEAAESRLSARVSAAGSHLRAHLDVVRAALDPELEDRPGAGEALGRSYAVAVDSGDRPLLATVAVTVAGLAARSGNHLEAAVLLGTAARLRGAHDPTDPRVRGLSGRARAALTDDRFDAAYDRGWRLAPAEAVLRTDPARLRSGAAEATG